MSCSKKKKAECIGSQCKWIVGVGCRKSTWKDPKEKVIVEEEKKISPRKSPVRKRTSPMRKITSPERKRTSPVRKITCSKKRKAECIGPGCKWIVGVGCKKSTLKEPKGKIIVEEKKKISPRKSPVRKKVSPVRQRTSPVRQRTSPVKKRTSPVKKMRQICESRDEDYKNQIELEEYIFSDKLNVNLVKIGKNLIEITDPSNRLKYTLQKSKILGQGSYGKVIKYTDRKNKVSLAVKFAKDKDEEEVSNNLKNIGCEILRVKFCKEIRRSDGFNYVFFTELADGDLEKWVKKYPGGIPVETVNNILKSIWKQLNCLLQHGMLYTDLKLRNILFKCDDPEHLGEKDVRIILGDIGSLSYEKIINGRKYISTYPPMETIHLYGPGHIFLRENDPRFKSKMEQILCWEFGIVIVQLLPYLQGIINNPIRSVILDLISQLNYNYISLLTTAKFIKTLNLINPMNTTKFNLMKYLDPIPQNRVWKI